MIKIFSKLLDLNQRELDRLSKIVSEINSLEPKIIKLKDGDFSKKTKEFKKRLKNGEAIENILPENLKLS